MRQGTCILRNLDNPLLSGIALGLDLNKEGLLTASPDMFPCCKGESYAWHAETRSVERCSIHARLSRLQQLLDQFKKTWPQATRLPHQVPHNQGHQILEELASVTRHDRPQATVTFNPQKGQASLLWSKAFAAVWRYGLETRIHRWDNFKPDELSALTAASSRPVLIFLELVDKLWDPGQADNFEFIVQQVYNAGYPIWIDFALDADAEAPADSSLKSHLVRRIQKMKSRHPIDLISPDCLSRLRSISGLSLKS